MATQLTESQARIIEKMGLDADDNSEFVEGFESAEAAVNWFLGEGWPFGDDEPVTDADRDALRAYVA